MRRVGVSQRGSSQKQGRFAWSFFAVRGGPKFNGAAWFRPVAAVGSVFRRDFTIMSANYAGPRATGEPTEPSEKTIRPGAAERRKREGFGGQTIIIVVCRAAFGHDLIQ